MDYERLTGCRQTLAQAVLALERLGERSRAWRSPAPPALSWKALARTGWTIVDTFEAGGRRYLVAHDAGEARAAADLLTLREREVAAQVVRGRSSKAIAYDLGLSPSTVRVHLARAFRKLGVTTREAFVRRYRE